MSDDKNTYTPPSKPPPSDGETRPLPEGWIKQFDPRSNAWFYVDTKAMPPKSIWVHPLDDPDFLTKHPEHKDYDSPPRYEGRSSPLPSPPLASSDKGKAPEKRGFFGKLKDKAIGTKEEREEAKRRREQELRERQERLAQQRAHAFQYGAPPQFQQYPGGYAQGQPAYGYGQPMYGQPGLAAPPRRAGGGMAMPLLGGLAGGLVLGELMGGDGFGGDGGDFGGGDFGGGDF